MQIIHAKNIPSHKNTFSSDLMISTQTSSKGYNLIRLWDLLQDG